MCYRGREGQLWLGWKIHCSTAPRHGWCMLLFQRYKPDPTKSRYLSHPVLVTLMRRRRKKGQGQKGAGSGDSQMLQRNRSSLPAKGELGSGVNQHWKAKHPAETSPGAAWDPAVAGSPKDRTAACWHDPATWASYPHTAVMLPSGASPDALIN